jgi:hypothetical protein
MENFFNWMSKPVPPDEITIWFNVHNLNYEKIELFGDFFKSLYETMKDTYLGEENGETKIAMSEEDKGLHFEWCWKATLDNFKKENIEFKKEGQHKDYFKSFFSDTFYGSKNLKIAIPDFLEDVFNLEKPFTKSDLDILTEVYHLLEKNMD